MFGETSKSVDKMWLKLSDFGKVKEFFDGFRTEKVKDQHGYKAPVFKNGKKLLDERELIMNDVWSLCVVFMCLATLEPPEYPNEFI